MTTSDIGNSTNNCVLDTGATHHVTSDIQNLSMHSNYTGNDEVILGNGTGISISHIGSSTLNTPSITFTLNNILCAPSVKNNLNSVTKIIRLLNFFLTVFL